MENAEPEEEDELVTREPSAGDLAELYPQLNRPGPRYLVIGGFAFRGAGYVRNTIDVDLGIPLFDGVLVGHAVLHDQRDEVFFWFRQDRNFLSSRPTCTGIGHRQSQSKPPGFSLGPLSL